MDRPLGPRQVPGPERHAAYEDIFGRHPAPRTGSSPQPPQGPYTAYPKFKSTRISPPPPKSIPAPARAAIPTRTHTSRSSMRRNTAAADTQADRQRRAYGHRASAHHTSQVSPRPPLTGLQARRV
ncbi:hypothetical protein B0H13DRAFT_2385262 [Mycena leptocephala]|nr:hypothetical protein B0H13DRAFT_2385262 [Mycena leptocephala]